MHNFDFLRDYERHKKTAAVMGVLLLVGAAILGRETKKAVLTGTEGKAQKAEEKFTVVVDAGHGGFDPGKIGIGNVMEKDINLNIARYVAFYLESFGVEVVMTRNTDEGLYQPEDTNKKVQDMKNRVSLIEETKPDACVSIHQNSYPEESIKGAQVFYYETSSPGAMLAQCIQSQLIDKADPSNKREIKPNKSYYMLKKTGSTIVIVECGFLSNPAEAKLLCSEQYSQRVAWAISKGVMQYLFSAY